MSGKPASKIKGRESIHKELKEAQQSHGSPSPSPVVFSSGEESSDETLDASQFNSTGPNASGWERSSGLKSTPESASTKKRRNKSANRNASPRRPSIVPRDSRDMSPRAKSSWLSYSLIIVIGALAFYFIYPWLKHDSTSFQNSEKKCSYLKLQKNYPQEPEKLWQRLKSGIEDMINNRTETPGVYLFLHNGQGKTKKLIRDIAFTSSSCFDSSMKPVEIKSVDFTSKNAINDYGYVIEKYKEIIKEGNVILIANLNEIPPEAARALHSICDTITPIVPKVMIFLSLVAEHNAGEKVIDTAMDSLQQLWQGKIAPNEIDALITRVTDEVVLLQTK